MYGHMHAACDTTRDTPVKDEGPGVVSPLARLRGKHVVQHPGWVYRVCSEQANGITDPEKRCALVLQKQ